MRQREQTEILSRVVSARKCAPKRTNRDLVLGQVFVRAKMCAKKNESRSRLELLAQGNVGQREQTEILS